MDTPCRPIYIQGMQATFKLSASDRDFFRLVAKTAFSNPFTKERAQFDRELAAHEPNNATDVAVAGKRAVAKRVGDLETRDAVDMRRYAAEDQQLLRPALLYDLCNRYADAFDTYIVDDLAAGEASTPVPFAGEALQQLVARGFAPSAACGYLALFYQMRRAHYFIDQSILGRTAIMQDFRRRLWNNVFTHDMELYQRCLWNRMENFSTLILGEPGTGKAAAAAAIGRSCFIPFDENKKRFARPISRTFIAMNIAQYPGARSEPELFGYRKDVPEGAAQKYEGVLARCCPHGAVFLDEIDELAPAVQVMLLRVLQERTFSPVGSHERKRFQGRLIAAVGRSPHAWLPAKEMRADFFYRLCSDRITVPSLRDRIHEDADELRPLVAQLLRRQLGTAAPDILDRVLDALHASPGMDYAWPGNVRELGHAVRRILLNGRYEPDAIGPEQKAFGTDNLLQSLHDGALSAAELQARYCALLYQRLGTYGEVARRTGLDWRTVKKYVEKGS